MTRDLPPFRRFIRRVHRRLVVVRVLEAGGIGLLTGSGLAVVLSLVLLQLGRPAGSAVATFMGVGTFCGIVAGLARRPGVLQSAMRADRQLDLADLLSTALVVDRGEAADPWARVVIAAADSRCAGLSPSAVLLRRFNGRAWGGITVVALLALTIAGFSAGSADAIAGREPSSHSALPSLAANLPPLPGTEATPARTADSVARRRTWSDPEDRNRSFAASSNRAEMRAEDTNPAADRADPSQAGSTDAAGSGSAKSSAPPIDGGRLQLPPRDAGMSPAPSDPTAPSAGGSGASANERMASTDAAPGGGSAASRAAQAAPPWRSTNWPKDVASAQQAADAGRVPDAYRDVVRDYFDRP